MTVYIVLDVKEDDDSDDIWYRIVKIFDTQEKAEDFIDVGQVLIQMDVE